MEYNIDFLKALADDTRFRIVVLLLEEEMKVTDIVEKIKKSQPNVSLALRRLSSSGIIEARKDGRSIYYSIPEKERIRSMLELVKR